MADLPPAETQPFGPSLQVLTAEPQHPRPPDVSWQALVQRFPGLAEAGPVCWTGSTAVGWGNALSDVDLFVFADHDVALPDDETSETWRSTDKSGFSWVNWVGRYADVCVDMQVWPTDALADVLAPYLTTPEPEFCGLSEELQDFVYRVSASVPLRDDAFFERMRGLIKGSSYSRSLARYLKSIAENQLTDVAGQLAADDVISARMSATLAAYSATDHCLVLAGELCRRPKWLLRRLETTPACGISVHDYRTQVLAGERPGETERESVVRTARWAQSNLIRVEDMALRTN